MATKELKHRAAERLAKRAKDVQGDVIAYIEGENHDNIVLRDFFGNIRKVLVCNGFRYILTK